MGGRLFLFSLSIAVRFILLFSSRDAAEADSFGKDGGLRLALTLLLWLWLWFVLGVVDGIL